MKTDLTVLTTRDLPGMIRIDGSYLSYLIKQSNKDHEESFVRTIRTEIVHTIDETGTYSAHPLERSDGPCFIHSSGFEQYSLRNFYPNGDIHRYFLYEISENGMVCFYQKTPIGLFQLIFQDPGPDQDTCLVPWDLADDSTDLGDNP